VGYKWKIAIKGITPVDTRYQYHLMLTMLICHQIILRSHLGMNIIHIISSNLQISRKKAFSWMLPNVMENVKAAKSQNRLT